MNNYFVISKVRKRILEEDLSAILEHYRRTGGKTDCFISNCTYKTFEMLDEARNYRRKLFLDDCDYAVFEYLPEKDCLVRVAFWGPDGSKDLQVDGKWVRVTYDTNEPFREQTPEGACQCLEDFCISLGVEYPNGQYAFLDEFEAACVECFHQAMQRAGSDIRELIILYLFMNTRILFKYENDDFYICDVFLLLGLYEQFQCEIREHIYTNCTEDEIDYYHRLTDNRFRCEDEIEEGEDYDGE